MLGWGGLEAECYFEFNDPKRNGFVSGNAQQKPTHEGKREQHCALRANLVHSHYIFVHLISSVS